MSWQLGAFTLLGLAIAAGFAWFERVRPDARIVALVGTLAAFAALGRIAFAAVPNVKPTTDIVLIAGFALGAGPGFAVGAIAGLSSNFFFGQGPWTPWQMAAWGAAGLIGAGLAALVRLAGGRRGALAAPAPAPLGRWPLAIVCGVTGFAFTVVQDVGDWVSFSDHSAAQLWVYIGQGLGFDAIHAVGCVGFALAFGPALSRSVQRFARRLQVTWLDDAAPAAPAVPVGSAGPLIAIAILAGCAAALTAVAGAGVSPARAATSSLVTRATAYLRAAENPDGGFGPAPGQPSNQLDTGWAALGLASAGSDLRTVTHGRGLIPYVEAAAGAPGDVGALERTILVAGAAGLPPRSFAGHDLVAALDHHIRADGSVAGQVNLTAFAVLALRAAGAGVPATSLRWLSGQQDHDGGFSFAGAGGGSDVDDTGATLEALAGDPAAAAVRARAVTYLRRQQDSDGGFPSQPGLGSNAQSTAWAIQGLDAAGVPAATVHRGARSPVGYLMALAAPGGAISYARGMVQTPVWVTGEALMALEGKPLPISAPPAVSAPAPPTQAAGVRATGRATRHVRRRAVSGTRGRRSRVVVGHHHAAHPRPAAVAAAAGAADRQMFRLAGAVGVLTALVLAPLGMS